MKRSRTPEDVQRYADWMALPEDAYVKAQLDGMFAHVTARKDILARVILEPHDHYGRPIEQPYTLETDA